MDREWAVSDIEKLVTEASVEVIDFGKSLQLTVDESLLPKAVRRWLALSKLLSSILTPLGEQERLVDAMNLAALHSASAVDYIIIDDSGLSWGMDSIEQVDIVGTLRAAAMSALMVLHAWFMDDDVTRITLRSGETVVSLNFDKRGLIRNQTNIPRTLDMELFRRAMISVKIPKLRQSYRYLVRGDTARFDELETAIDEIRCLVVSAGIILSMNKV